MSHLIVGRHEVGRAVRVAELSLQNLSSQRAEVPSKDEVIQLLRENNAYLAAHLYTPPEIQDIAIESGGIVADSLEMARAGAQSSASTLVVCGVRFMGETAKILSMDKRVLMPDMTATCSLDISCPSDRFQDFCAEHADREVVVYANTSAEVKACADWVVTSSIAVDVIQHLEEQGRPILWAPDKHLGRYLQYQTGADMLLWDGACIVHEEFQAQGLEAVRLAYPEAGVLAHPEAPLAVLQVADFVGSTSQIIAAASRLPHTLFIVATDRGMFHALRRKVPGKEFIPAPTGGQGATCRSCARCPWMQLNHLQALAHVFERDEGSSGEVLVDSALAERARKPLERMLAFPVGQGEQEQRFTSPRILRAEPLRESSIG